MRSLTIAVDVDETIADLLGPWLRRYNREFNDTVLPEDLTEWDLTKALKPECGSKIYELLDASLYDEILPLPNARHAISVLRAIGHRCVFVTSCINNTADAKLHWLVRHGFLERRRFQPDYITASDKSLIRADVLLDDRAETVEKFPGMAWLISQPQNRTIKTTRPRLNSIAEAPAAISKWDVFSPYRDAA
jgi:5'(3')-deoxyribonucleotidase